jgi:hypothetical protein
MLLQAQCPRIVFFFLGYVVMGIVEQVESLVQTAVPGKVRIDGQVIAQVLAVVDRSLLDFADRPVNFTSSPGSSSVSNFTCLDAQKDPKGPVSRTELDSLLQSGGITLQTDVLKTGTSGWVKRADV